MASTQALELPPVASWRIHMLRLAYVLMAGVMGPFVWQQVLLETEPWPAPRVIAKSMLASLALLSVLGLRYPLQMLPLMLLEALWKAVAILLIILPAWLAQRMTPDLQLLFSECIGIVVVYLVMPWRYVWARYVRHPGEAWRSPRNPLPARGHHRWEPLARAALSGSATAWLLVTLAGQVIFAAYVARFYGGAAVAGEYERWNKVLPRGFDATDPLGTAMLGLHLLLALAWVLGGALQLIPAVRRHAPALHRWNGRLYIGCVAMLAAGGLWLVWVRGGVVGDLAQHLAISINALLILGCAAMAWRAARSRRFGDHRRWALRLFVVASGVWFFRVGLMAWLAVHQRPVGFDATTFQGPFLTLLAFGVYVVLPLPLLQLYLTAKERGGPAAQLGVAAVIGIVALATCGGTFAAAMGLWLPRMSL